MILVRDVFQLRFGKARDAMALWKEGLTIAQTAGVSAPARLLTDFAGLNYYTLVMEMSFPSLADYEQQLKNLLSTEEWKEWYQRFLPLVESGHREVLTIVE